MSSFNKVILMGNLTRDPELRVTPKGVSVCQFSLAVNSTYRDKDGNPKDEVAFVDIDAFGKQADVISKYLLKGRPLLVEGRLKFDTWEDKEGGRRSKLKVVLEGFQFVGAPARGSDATDAAAEASSRRTFPPARPTRAKARPSAAASGVAAAEKLPF